jgi:hypothetical protein
MVSSLSLMPSPLPLSRRWMTVEDSELWLNRKYQGDMVASLSSYLPNGGSDGKLSWYTLVRDKVSVSLMFFNTTAHWATEQGWGSDGMTLVDSKFLVSGFDWDFHESAAYGSNRFSLEMWNRNRHNKELGFVSGVGRYGGKSWHHWYVSSFLIS